jgi:hypothetical protein
MVNKGHKDCSLLQSQVGSKMYNRFGEKMYIYS